MAMEVRLSREMRLIDSTMIGVGAMIGAGIFVLTGVAAGVAGPALILVFALNGVVALLTAMTYAELGSAFHAAGGGYTWVKSALPDPNGFLSGWMSWFAQAVACALYSLGFGAYFRLVLESVGLADPRAGGLALEKWLAIIVCVLFAYVNYRGAAETGKAGNVVTVGKIAVIGIFVVAGLWVMARSPGWTASFEPFMAAGWGGVFAAMGLTFIAFEGYEIIAQTSEEVENPRRNVPRAVFLSLIIVVPIYLLVALVAIGAVSAPEGMTVTEYLGREKETALVTAARQFIPAGGIIILIGGLLSTLSALNATTYSSSRVAFAMARDANLPQFLGKVHSTRATPHVAIFFSAIIVIVMAVTLPIEDVAAAANVMFLLLFVQVNLAAIRLRRTRPEVERGFRVPMMPLLPIIAIITMLCLAVFLFIHYPMGWVAAGAWIVAGAGVYYGYSRRSEAAFLEREEWMERIERKEYRVLVAVYDPRYMQTLMEVGVAIARKHSGEIVVLSVAEVPEGQTLMSGRRSVRRLEPLLERAVRYAEEQDVAARPVVKIARRVSHGIVETAREERCNFLVMGQPRPQSVLERIVASTGERVLHDAPCQVGMVYGALRPGSVTGITVPITKGANPQLAAELAPAFTERFGAAARAVTVIGHGTDPADAEKMVKEAKETLKASGLDAELVVFRRREVAYGLARVLRKGDLVLMGAASSGSVAALLEDSVPAVIGKMGRNPMVVVRDVAEERARRFERVFFGRR